MSLPTDSRKMSIFFSSTRMVLAMVCGASRVEVAAGAAFSGAGASSLTTASGAAVTALGLELGLQILEKHAEKFRDNGVDFQAALFVHFQTVVELAQDIHDVLFSHFEQGLEHVFRDS